MKKLLLALLFTPQVVADGLYFDVGLGMHAENFDDVKIQNPIGILELGYEATDRLTISVVHKSSITEKDYGYNAVEIRYRLFK